MADLCCKYTIAGITLNDDTPGADRLVIGEDGVKGLDGRPIRRQVDPAGYNVEGGIIHPARFGPRLILFSGIVNVQSTLYDPTDDYFAAVYALEQAVIAALEGIRNTDGTLAWTPHGGSPQTLTVRYGLPGQEIQFAGPMLNKRFVFGLVADFTAVPIP